MDAAVVWLAYSNLEGKVIKEDVFHPIHGTFSKSAFTYTNLINISNLSASIIFQHKRKQYTVRAVDGCSSGTRQSSKFAALCNLHIYFADVLRRIINYISAFIGLQ